MRVTEIYNEIILLEKVYNDFITEYKNVYQVLQDVEEEEINPPDESQPKKINGKTTREESWVFDNKTRQLSITLTGEKTSTMYEIPEESDYEKYAQYISNRASQANKIFQPSPSTTQPPPIIEGLRHSQTTQGEKWIFNEVSRELRLTRFDGKEVTLLVLKSRTPEDVAQDYSNMLHDAQNPVTEEEKPSEIELPEGLQPKVQSETVNSYKKKGTTEKGGRWTYADGFISIQYPDDYGPHFVKTLGRDPSTVAKECDEQKVQIEDAVTVDENQYTEPIGPEDPGHGIFGRLKKSLGRGIPQFKEGVNNNE